MRNRYLCFTEGQLEGTSISIVIPAHQSGVTLNRCLQSIVDFGVGVKDIILVLDGLRYDSEQFNLPTVPGLKIKELAESKGPAYARNHGVRYASGNILFFLDSDVQLLPDTIGRVKAHFEKPDTSEALIGSYDNSPSEEDLISKYRNLLHHFTHQTGHEQVSTFWGACGAIRKEVFELTDGFNTSYHQASIEDIEFGYRLMDRGYQVRLDKALQIKHMKRWSLRNVIQTDIHKRARPWTRLLHVRKKLDSKEFNLSNEERLSTILLLLGMMSLTVSFFWTDLILLTILPYTGLILTKRKLYRFFASQFKTFQLPLVVMLHWLYLLCAFTGFVLGTCDYLLQTIHPRSVAETVMENQYETGS